MKRTKYHLPGTRARFDYHLCHFSKGWGQADTDDDAPYYGIWIHPTDLKVCMFIEGDVIEMTASNKLEFIGYVRYLARDESWRGIDPLCQDDIEQAFRDLGLADLFHPNLRST